MWVVFQKDDKVIVGATADGSQDPPKDIAIADTVRGLVSPRSIEEYDAVQVKDRERALKILDAMRLQTIKVAENKGLLDVAEDDTNEVFLSVTVEGAEATHAVDQVPLIQATPTAFVTIKLQKLDPKGKPLTRKTVDKEVLWLRTDAGFLRSDQVPPMGGAGAMPPDIRSVTLVSGAASFRLYAEPAKRLATVQILHQDPKLNSAVRVEFI